MKLLFPKKTALNKWARHWALPGLLCATLALFQPRLEQSMVLHMGVEIPLLFILGWLTANACGPALVKKLAPWNMAGVPGLTFALLVISLWMVPAALDYAVLSAPVAIAKVASLLAAGMAAGLSWKPAGFIVQAFFTMNAFWMTFVVGLLYREAPLQLCSVYLEDEQARAGAAIMAWAILALLLWVPGVLRKLRD
ncbi:hypothetical protein TKWG_09085 [Advenella kashmirensis WT001]|uniref:Transmembrane protein n=1 Tax=Advenella kashmirensis (strain DSM 17095 / LMG 22695 / WT001) TaxID=1036672 RepID=I3UAW3_ADVKW|nr:hypothetical protein [Advenella kashmirensis]AFK62151.1 hypothetical protein TKWG_09085 [Advenella kashmirensis WT001]